MEVKDGYKQTEIGVIPDDWEVKSISEFSSCVRGGSPRPAGSPRYFNGEFIPWLTVAALTNISPSQLYVYETESCLTEEGSHYSRTLEKGTLIISNSGATLGIAKLLSIKCCANDGIAVLKEFSKNIEKAYIVYFINSITKRLRDVVATGNGQPNLNTNLILKVKIPLPPTKSEQTAITTILRDADALITNLEKLIEKKRAIKQGALQELFIPKNNWEEKTYGEIFLFLNSATYSRAQLTETDKIKYIHYGDIHTKWNFQIDIQNNVLPSIKNDQLKDYSIIREGDVIMADASEDYSGVGKSVEVKNVGDIKAIAGLHTFLLRDVNGVFVNGFRSYIHIIRSVKKQFDELATGMKVYGVSKANLKNVYTPVPPIEEQTSIATILSDMDAEITALEQKLGKYKMIKQGMMQKLLTGKIRLIFK